MSDAPLASPESAPRQGILKAIAASPFGGIAPWVLMSIISGPGTFEIAVLLALATSLTVFLVSRKSGDSIKLMEVFDLIFFAGFAIVGAAATPAVITWLENWAGEITNIALVLFVVITLALKQPFTLQYAKEQTDPKYWNTPAFLRINYAITWVWAGAFLWQSLMGFIGDFFLDNSNNFWTGWILQIAAMIFAISFTEYWPDHVRAQGQGIVGPSPLSLWAWLPTYVIITGVAALLTSDTSTVVGVALIVVGAIAAGLVSKRLSAHDADAPRLAG